MRHFLLSALILLVSAGSALAEVKIAFVDMQRALLEVEDGKVAKGKLESMKKERQEKLDARQEELRNLQKQFEAQKEFMKEEVRKQKEQEFGMKLQELQRLYVDLQKELAQEEAKLTKGIFTRMARILKSVGEAESFSMIFEKTESSILWAPQHLDLTNDVIRRYNAGEGKEDKKKEEKKDK